jgi:hypothetical protein
MSINGPYVGELVLNLVPLEDGGNLFGGAASKVESFQSLKGMPLKEIVGRQ